MKPGRNFRIADNTSTPAKRCLCVISCPQLPTMNVFFRVALIAIVSAMSCAAQTASLTFYSPSISIKSAAAVFAPKSEQPFGGLQGGWLFDGSQRLARVRAGRFVTFHLNPGEHTFTDAGPTGSSKKSLVINVKDGGQYCVRLFAKMVNLDVYSQWQNQIEEISCQQAQREAAHLKPIETKRVDPAVRTQLDTATTFPDDSPKQR